MVERTDSITIDRPVDEVFAYVTDTSNDPAWHTDILEARKLTEGPIGIGTRWHLKLKPFMGLSETGGEVTALESNRLEVLSGEIMRGRAGPMQPTTTYRFEPAEGATRVTRRVQIKVSGPMRLMHPIMQWVDLPRRNRRFLSNLKRVLERDR